MLNLKIIKLYFPLFFVSNQFFKANFESLSWDKNKYTVKIGIYILTRLKCF